MIAQIHMRHRVLVKKRSNVKPTLVLMKTSTQVQIRTPKKDIVYPNSTCGKPIPFRLFRKKFTRGIDRITQSTITRNYT